MHAVYDEKLNIVLWDYKVTTVQTLKITAYLGNDHGSRHFLLNGPKLQNTNCTETFLLAAILRNQNQTSGRLLANNNNSEGFSNSSPSVVSVSFHQSCPGLDDVRSIDNAKSSSSFWTKNLSFEMWQIFCLPEPNAYYVMSNRSFVKTVCSFYFPSNFSFRIQPHSSPIEVTSKIWTSFNYTI